MDNQKSQGYKDALKVIDESPILTDVEKQKQACKLLKVYIAASLEEALSIFNRILALLRFYKEYKRKLNDRRKERYK